MSSTIRITTSRMARLAFVKYGAVATAGAAGALAGCGTTPARTSTLLPATAAVTQAAVDTLSANFLSAWNSHNAAAIAATYTVDADFTNPFGVYKHGRADILALHMAVFAGPFANSTQTFVSSATKMLDAAFASVEMHWSLTGATVPGWPATQTGITNWIVALQPDGSVQIAVVHNIVPQAMPIPMPTPLPS